MRYVKEFAVVLALLMLAGCAGKPVQESPVATDEGIPAGQIYLYGEIHGIAAIEEYEAERWKECYERGMRHLFVELSHYTAQWLNLWMDAEDDEILEQLHQDWESTLSSGAETLDFYRTIKEQCPETVFHGTDVGPPVRQHRGPLPRLSGGAGPGGHGGLPPDPGGHPAGENLCRAWLRYLPGKPDGRELHPGV